MASYLLLRNNKESGPYSLDDLMDLGLKAYDLVWIQGKSAAWRYPSEVEELKPFSPVVEEQPFDRFFKKQSEEKKEEPPKQEIQQQEVPKQEIPAIKPEHEKYIPKKSVFVTMPGQKGVPAQPVKRTEDVPAAKVENVPTPVLVQQTITVSENPAAAQIKYSQPLDEIKEMYVKTLQERKQKIARKNFWLQSLKQAAVILSLVAAGVITGLIIKSNGGKKDQLVQANEPSLPQQKFTGAVTGTQDSIVLPNIQQTIPLTPEEYVVNDKPASLEKVDESQRPSEKTNAAEPKKDVPLILSENETRSSFISPGADTDPSTGERNRKVRSSTNNHQNNPAPHSVKPEEVGSVPNQLSGVVTVTSNEYKKVAFGGIRDLQITVTNDSKYELDNVIVELQYLKPSEQPLRTENIHFKSIAAKTSATIKVPDTNRGIKVAYRIITIKSRQMDEGVARIQD